jgi:branched-chain amino acid transport system substrate-binding protein
MLRALKQAFLICAAIALAPPPGFCDPAPVKLGALIHLTGDLASQGTAFRQGIELAVSEINSNRLPTDRTLEVIFEDTALKPELAFKAAKKLLEVDGVVAGFVSTSAETKSAGTLFEAKRIPLICMWDSSPEVEAIGNYVFGIGTWTPSAGEKVAEHMFKVLGIRKAAVINNIDEWSLTVSEAFSKQFKKLGGDVVYTDSVNPDDSDFRSTISRMRSASPEALYAPIGFNTALFFKQLRQQRFEKPTYMSDNLSPEIIAASAGAAEMAFQTQSADPQGSRFSHMAQLYRARFGKEPAMPIYTAWGYDAVHLVTKALTNARGDTTKINAELYKVREYAGASGTISISEEGSSRASVSLFQVRNSKLELVEN